MIHCYSQAAANTRLVGLEVARLVNVLVDQHGTDPLQVKVSCDVTKPPYGQVHIIGHSLGAHIAGYAGERITNLGRCPLCHWLS